MPKIQNLKLANQLAAISTEMVQFDEKGIGEVKSPELHAELLTLANFFPVEEPVVEEVVVEEPVEEPKVEARTVKKITKK